MAARGWCHRVTETGQGPCQWGAFEAKCSRALPATQHSRVHGGLTGAWLCAVGLLWGPLLPCSFPQPHTAPSSYEMGHRSGATEGDREEKTELFLPWNSSLLHISFSLV